jgi:thioesterase domain-containing protein
MDADELARYLHEHIPLSHAMQVGVVSIGYDSVVLSAPLAPNINHRATVFGGSASAVAILAAWSLLHVRLTADGYESRLVIQRNSMDYLAPISGDFTARSMLAEGSDWSSFTRMLTRRGKARITVESVLEADGQIAGRLSGEFVALGKGL